MPSAERVQRVPLGVNKFAAMFSISARPAETIERGKGIELRGALFPTLDPLIPSQLPLAEKCW
jgi:hypothetical protein